MSGEPASQLSSAPINILEQWPQVATIVTGSTVVLSVVYNWSYFSVVDPSAIQLLTISDHISSALQWLPASILTGAFYGIMAAVPDIIARSPPRPQLPAIWARIIGVFLIFITIVSYLFTGFFRLDTRASMRRFSVDIFRDAYRPKARMARTDQSIDDTYSYCVIVEHFGRK